MNNWPSTTQVLHDAGLYGDLARWSDSEAMRRGRLVDAACNLLLMQKQLPESWETDHPECVPFIDGYRMFLAKHNPVIMLACAFEVVNKVERYVGHPDQLVMLDGVRALLDLKTGGMPAPTALQLASYEMALDPEMIRTCPKTPTIRVGLQLSRGDFRLHYFFDPRIKDEWLILVRAWWVKHKYVAAGL